MFAELQGALHSLARLDSLIGNYLGRVRRRILLRRRGYRRVVTSAKVNRPFFGDAWLIASNQGIADTCGRECDKNFHRSPPKYRFHLIVKNRDRCTMPSDTQ
jgi:hypothetical protein